MSDEMLLRVSPDLVLPLDAVTQTFAILAKRGAGKTNTGRVMAEEMVAAGVPWLAVDPVGSWWGIRADGDGGPGLPVVVFGGEHGDLPLEPTAGAVLADMVVDQRDTMPWVVFDLSDMADADLRRFVIGLVRQVYRRNRLPLHLFFEEAEVILPQQVRANDAPMVGAVQKLIKLGRARGLGCTLITQRSASLNKDGLTQVETLIAMRTTGPQDRAAILGWVKDHEGGSEAVAALPDLQAGEAFVFSPGWLGDLQRVKFRRSHTFDSGATPELGQPIRPVTMADLDLGAIKEAMAATIEKADAQDPRKLQARVRDLERQLAGQAPPAELQQARMRIARLEGALAGAGYALTDLRRRAAEIEDLISRDVQDLGAGPPVAAKEGEAIQPGSSAAGSASDRPANGSRRVPPSPRGREAGRTAGDAPSGPDRSPDPRLGRAERAVLAVLVQHGPQTQRQLAVHAGYSTRASTIGVALSKLRQLGLVEPGHGPYSATDSGRALLGDLPQLPTGQALRDYWMARLGKAERAALELLLEAWPDPVPTGELARAAGYSPQASTMGVALSKLRTFGLVDGNRASDELAKGVR